MNKWATFSVPLLILAVGMANFNSEVNSIRFSGAVLKQRALMLGRQAMTEAEPLLNSTRIQKIKENAINIKNR